MMHAASTECPACGFIFEVEKKQDYNGNIKMNTVDFKAKVKSKPFMFTISDGGMEIYTSKKGNKMIKIWLQDNTFVPPKFINVFWQFEIDAHEYARKKARLEWFNLTGTKPPETSEEAMERESEIYMNIPERIEAIQDGDYLKVNRWRLHGVNPKPIQKQELIEDEIPF